jgi:hypothetical protein
MSSSTTAAELSDGKVIEKRRLIVNEFMSLDGVVQAPGAADEDTSGGFNHGGWHLRYMEDQLAQRWALVGIVEAGGFLLERGGDERVTQGVGSHTLGDPGPAGDTAHDPSGAWRSMRLPPVPTKIGRSQRSPTARSMALAVRGARGTVTTLPPLRRMVSVRWLRSRPRSSMSARRWLRGLAVR